MKNIFAEEESFDAKPLKDAIHDFLEISAHYCSLRHGRLIDSGSI